MAAATSLSSIIRYYAEKQKSAFIDFHEFCVYIKKYAEYHVEEQPELAKYLGDPTPTVSAELEGLQEKKLAAVITNNKKKTIVSISYFSVKFAGQFKEILVADATPYPVITDLPKQFPPNYLEIKLADTYIPQALEKQDLKSPALYVIQFQHELPSMLLPACVPVKVIMETALNKIRAMLQKEESHDYFLKKLRSSNPGKEITIQSFFANFVDNKNQTDITKSLAGDDYYYWSQLCYFIRQDYEKIQDKTVKDINILQAIEFTEIHNTFLKQKSQNEQRKNDALNELSFNLTKPPYFFSMDQILKFKDKNGKTLYGQYNEQDFKDFMTKQTGEAVSNHLPNLLVFKVASGTRYFVVKTKVPALITRLCSEARNVINQTLENEWFETLYAYAKLPEMTNPQEFEKVLADQIESKSPVLWALLNANFMSLMVYEKEIDESMDLYAIFDGTQIRPYSDLLQLKNHAILSAAKYRLPFWYSMPVISWIAALFHLKGNKAGAKKTPPKQKQTTAMNVGDVEIPDFDDKGNLADKKPKLKTKHKKDILAQAAEEIAKEFVPEGSSLDRELDFLCKQWNKMISVQANVQLTEDVNSLIRDYMRKVINTLSESTFTADRVRSLAKSLVKTPNMQKITEEKALTEYVELYILKLVSNK